MGDHDPMQEVLQLMQARASGAATNEQVESAVANLLSSQATLPNSLDTNNDTSAITQCNDEDKVSSSSKKRKIQDAEVVMPQPEDATVEVDEEDYDDPEPAAPPKLQQQAVQPEVATMMLPQFQMPPLPVPPLMPPPVTTPFPPYRKRGRPRKHPMPAPDRHPIDWSVYEDIPLGKQGAKMMTTFGDDRQPDPKVVEATLLGARQKVLVAIRDARHFRTGVRKKFSGAQRAMRAYRPEKPSQTGNVSMELEFRAVVGYDKLSYDPKCGFAMEELLTLYPEEMTAFTRWNFMHKHASKLSKEEPEQVANESDDEEGAGQQPQAEDDENGEQNDIPIPPPLGGHLEERASQFDTRTDRMVGDWYVKFSDVRTGSFLPRRTRMKGDANWNSNRSKKTGSHKSGSWAHFPATSVRFLHWLGFDPQSALPPPGQEATEALGFLAYDFFGRIVEKAIFFRKLKQYGGDHMKVVLELDKDEKLTPEDIQQAMEDPDIKPIPLYATTETTGDKATSAPQLYFGPGFEMRMELEMELAMNYDEQTEEDINKQRDEDALFTKLSAPPKKDTIDKLLNKKPKASNKKKTKTAKEKKAAK